MRPSRRYREIHRCGERAPRYGAEEHSRTKSAVRAKCRDSDRGCPAAAAWRWGRAPFRAARAKAGVPPAPACRFGVLACADQPSRASLSPDVVGELVAGSPGPPGAAVAALDEFDVVVVQHEFGIFG